MIALDTNDDAHIVQRDIQISLTYAEHELICEVLRQASDAFDFTCSYELQNLPLDSEIVRRYNILENLRETFYVLWSDRFSQVKK
jgi:hypothetical protein